MKKSLTRSLALGVFAVGASLAAPASADIVQSFYVSSSNYWWKATGMTDLDQRRDNCCGSPGLPGDGGMYCVPTAAINLFCYAANHGYAFVSPGSGNWQSNGKYDQANDAIALMGAFMSTSASGGTNGTGCKNGYATWTTLLSGGILNYHHYSISGGYNVRAFKIAQKATQGSIVSFCYGRYNVVGSIGGVPVIDRTGGHAVTLQEIKNVGNGTIIRYRDPASDGTNATQSDFVSKQVTATAISVRFDWDPTNVRTVTAIDYPSSDGKIRIIDSFVTLKPFMGLSFTNSDGLVLQKIAPYALEGQGGGTIKLNGATGISDLQLDADGIDALAIVNTSSTAGFTQLRRIGLATGEETALGSLNSLKRLCVDRGGTIFAHDGAKLYKLDSSGELLAAISSLPVPTGLATDDENDHVIVLSVPEKRIRRLNSDMGTVSTFNIAPGVPMSGDGSVTVNPLDNAVYFVTDGSNNIYRLAGVGPLFAFSTITVPGLVNPKGISASDDGKLFVSSQGKMKVLVETSDGKGNSWVLDVDSPFFNTSIGNRLAMQTSRSNLDPALHDSPGWDVNILPDELLPLGFDVPDCLADLDGNNVVDGADLTRLLANWGATTGNSDIDQNGIVDAADLTALLAGWGNCP